MISKINDYFKNNVKGKTFAVWGLAFKPRTDDMREAPSIAVINKLLQMGAKIRAYDPEATKNAESLFGDSVRFTEGNYEALEGADALVVLTEWNEFRRPNFETIRLMLSQPVIFDGRNIYDPEVLRKSGFTYFGVGT